MKSYLLLTTLLLLSLLCKAQWVPNGIQLSSTTGDASYNEQIAVNSNNSAWEVWRAEDTIVFAGSIYLTGYDKTGTPLSGFAGGAIQIAANGDYDMPQIMVSSDSNIIVTWYGNADSTSNFREVYIQKYTQNGVALWNIGIPMQVSLTDSSQNMFPLITSDKNGGAYICWTRYDYALDPDSSKILLQRIDNNGNVAAGWDATPVRIGDVANQNEWYPKMAVTPAGDAVYVQYIRGLITSLTSWVVRINAADGSAASGFSTGSGVEISTGPNLYPVPEVENFVFCDSLGNALSVWTEGRISANGEIYYQKTLTTGVQSLANNGVMIAGNSNEGYSYMYASLDDDGSILATWNDYVNNYDVGCIKFNTNGISVWQHANYPLTDNATSAYPKILPDHEGGSYIFYDGIAGYPDTLYCVRLSAAGALFWPLPGLYVDLNYDVDGFDPQFDFQVANADSDEANVTWEYTTTGLFNVYACDVLPSGQSCFDLPTAVPSINAPLNGMTITPNPSKDMFTVSISGPPSSSPAWFNLYNEIGMLVLQQSIKESAVISTSALATGFYFGKAFDEKGNCLGVEKIIIQ